MFLWTTSPLGNLDHSFRITHKYSQLNLKQEGHSFANNYKSYTKQWLHASAPRGSPVFSPWWGSENRFTSLAALELWHTPTVWFDLSQSNTWNCLANNEDTENQRIAKPLMIPWTWIKKKKSKEMMHGLKTSERTRFLKKGQDNLSVRLTLSPFYFFINKATSFNQWIPIRKALKEI